MRRFSLSIGLAAVLSGCAGLQFYDANTGPDRGRVPFRRNDLVSFHEALPGALVAYGGDCSVSVTMVTLPGARRYVRLKSGYGSSKLSVAFGASGTISTLGQETDTKVPETITAIGGALKNAADAKLLAFDADKSKPDVGACRARAQLYRLADGGLGTLVGDFPASPVAKPGTASVSQTPGDAAEALIADCRKVVDGAPVSAPTPAMAAGVVAECRRLLRTDPSP